MSPGNYNNPHEYKARASDRDRAAAPGHFPTARNMTPAQRASLKRHLETRVSRQIKELCASLEPLPAEKLARKDVMDRVRRIVAKCFPGTSDIFFFFVGGVCGLDELCFRPSPLIVMLEFFFSG
jgi:DNA polymerase sigma